MNLQELLTINQSVKGQLNKIETEVVNKIDELQVQIAELTDALDGATLTPEQEQSVTDLQTAAQALDDIVPDTIPPTTGG